MEGEARVGMVRTWRRVATVLMVTAVMAAAVGAVASAQSRPARLAVSANVADYVVVIPQAGNQELLASLRLGQENNQSTFTIGIGMRFPGGSASSFGQAMLQLTNAGNQTSFGAQLGYGLTYPLTASGVRLSGGVQLLFGSGAARLDPFLFFELPLS